MPGQWAHSTRAQRLPPGWARTTRRIMRTHNGICHVCHQPGADQIDHIEPGDDHGDHNLAPIHAVPCHRNKSANEGVHARTRIASARYRTSEQHPGMRSTQ